MAELAPDDPRHGTPRGASAHRRAGIPLCDPCRAAENEQRRKERQAPGVAASQRRARKAVAILKRRHFQEYRRILADLQKAEGEW